MSLLRGVILLVVAGLCLAGMARAHEVNPAYLELSETQAGEFDVIWKQPLKDGRRLRLTPQFPQACTATSPRMQVAGASVVERWTLTCALEAGIVRIEGLERTLTDVFLRIDRLDGEATTAVLRPTDPAYDLTAPSEGAVLQAYFRIGVEHILFGYDHLLFVLGLCLVVKARQLFATVTAFTLAHSFTLGLSALAGISLAGPPVETVIALSIVLLGREALARQAGQAGLTSQLPWLIAFGFGLIHGFGFAGALKEIGLPQDEEVWALLLFNLGVEAGQVLFVAAVLALAAMLAWISRAALKPVRALAAYFIGVAGTVWLIERISSFPYSV